LGLRQEDTRDSRRTYLPSHQMFFHRRQWARSWAWGAWQERLEECLSRRSLGILCNGRVATWFLSSSQGLLTWLRLLAFNCFRQSCNRYNFSNRDVVLDNFRLSGTNAL